MIDLTKLKAGDTVKFRCGGDGVVEIVRDDELAASYRFNLKLTGYTSLPFNYQIRGTCGGTLAETPFDIIEIVPKAFEWSEVKPGMAFADFSGNIVIFECFSVFLNSMDQKVAICTRETPYHDQVAYRYHTSELTRTPEHDIEVKP